MIMMMMMNDGGCDDDRERKLFMTCMVSNLEEQ